MTDASATRSSSQEQTAPRPSDQKLGLREKIGYGLGDMGFNFYWAIIGSYLMFFYTDIFGLSAAAAAWMFTITKVIDACTDPAMGAIADRTNSRWGKFRPYLLFGALPMAGAAILTMSTPDLEGTAKLVWAYGTYCAMMLCYTVLSTPYSSLAGVITSNAQERNSLFGIRFFFAYTTGIIVGAATPDLAQYFGDGDPEKGWRATMIVYSCAATLLFWVTFFSTKERIQPPKDQKSNPGQDILDLIRNKPWLILFALAMIVMITIVLRASSAAYYFKYFVERPDLMGPFIGLQMAAYAVGAVCTPFLTKRFDKAPLLMVLMSIVGVLSILFTFVPKPEANGVVTINTDDEITLEAEDLLGLEHREGDSYKWIRHEQVFWIISEPVEVGSGREFVTLSDQQGSVISVLKSNGSGDGVVVDSSDLPIEIIFMFTLNILISLALGPKSPLTWSMYADAADYNVWKTGRRATAMTFSAATFSQKLGGALGSAAIGGVLASLGYAANQVQSDASQTGIVLLQTAIPGVFAFIAVVALRYYDLSGEKLEQIHADLKARGQES